MRLELPRVGAVVSVRAGWGSNGLGCDEVKRHGSNEPKHEKYVGANRSSLTFENASEEPR